MDWRSSPECTELMPPMDNFSNSLLALADWLQEAGCTHVAMESTGVYTLPGILPIGYWSGNMA
jgi:hypothetical protein